MTASSTSFITAERFTEWYRADQLDSVHAAVFDRYLPRVSLALLFFNVGVEIGQLLFVVAVLGLVALARRLPVPLPAWAWRMPPYAIGSIAMFWVIQRIAAFQSG